MAGPPITIARILELLPHRPPMLFIDRVLEVTPDETVAEKLVSIGEPVLAGHFPGEPIVPGVLLIEAMAQTAALGVLVNSPEQRGRGMALLGINRARFRRPVVPGDRVRIHVKLVRRHGDVYRFAGTAQVEGDLVAEAELMAAFLDRKEED
ncbi:MAG: 3-hydroxyacyl-ACP dehydratase FabZ [Myxococcota bacterium]